MADMIAKLEAENKRLAGEKEELVHKLEIVEHDMIPEDF